jgi:hydrogenase/urease accessory protein HupE
LTQPAFLRLSRAVVALTTALVVGHPRAAYAHDPGLSSLEVRVASSAIIATLSLSAVDRQALAEDGEALDVVALDNIELQLDGARLNGRVGTKGAGTDGVVLTFEHLPASRLTIRSNVPGRLAIGHRELLTVRGPDGELVAERMLDARENFLDVDLIVRHEKRSVESTSRGTGSVASAPQFLALGVRHILGGFDHLAFLAALLLGVQRLGSVVKTVTAFTFAHSVTLAASVLGFVDMPAAIVEPLIALSIVFVGVENLVREPMESRWRLTFAFGLIHGFGFAGALRELGIGAAGSSIAVPLGAFNVGVEMGQIALAAVWWPLVRRLQSAPLAALRLASACSLLVAMSGIYWLLERTLSR